jgi:hypothetical protein
MKEKRCAVCDHPDWQHIKGGPCGIDICVCEKYSERLDPTPPEELNTDDE